MKKTINTNELFDEMNNREIMNLEGGVGQVVKGFVIDYLIGKAIDYVTNPKTYTNKLDSYEKALKNGTVQPCPFQC